jgi:MFS family permease
MRAMLLTSEWISGVGFALSLGLHLWSLANFRPPFEKHVWTLHIMIFLLAIAAMWAVYVLRRHLKGWAYLRAAFTNKVHREIFRECPEWVPKVLAYLFAYFAVHMSILFIRTKDQTVPSEIVVGQTPLYVFVVFSVGWMFCYAFMGAIFHSALHAVDKSRECPNGHAARVYLNRCEVCGRVLRPKGT